MQWVTQSPWHLIEVAIEPKSKADQEKLGIALSWLAAEDLAFRVITDARSWDRSSSGA